MSVSHPSVDGLEVSAYRIPTPEPEADGTLTWDATSVVVAQPSAAGVTGLGFTYHSVACATVIEGHLRGAVIGTDAMDVDATWSEMVRRIRNFGRPGVVSAAIAAVDTALWDLKAKLLDLPLVSLLGAVRDEVAVYGSGGFTSLDDDALCEQLGAWVHGDGIPRVKMKIGTDRGAEERRDLARVALARAAIGEGAELYVDANGAYDRKQAIRLARSFRDCGVTWFEEPVSSDDLDGLRVVREGTDLDVAAGEYGSDLVYFERMCRAGAVDVLQVDVSRCAGITEWRRAAAVAAGWGLEVSGHCAQSLHAAVACSVPNVRHLEYFADHDRVDRVLFDGVLGPKGGHLHPDRSRPGNGLTLRTADGEPYRIL